MAIFESFISHKLPTHILIIHVLVSEGLDMIMDHQLYLVPKDPPPKALYVNDALRLNPANLNWLDLKLTDDEDWISRDV